MKNAAVGTLSSLSAQMTREDFLSQECARNVVDIGGVKDMVNFCEVLCTELLCTMKDFLNNKYSAGLASKELQSRKIFTIFQETNNVCIFL